MNEQQKLTPEQESLLSLAHALEPQNVSRLNRADYVRIDQCIAVLAKALERLDAVQAECDKLKAEIEGLRKPSSAEPIPVHETDWRKMPRLDTTQATTALLKTDAT